MRRRILRRVGLAILLIIWALTTRGKFSVTGDEPHYLIICESIVADGDFDLQNNYAQNDGRLFGHDGLRDDGHTRLTAAGAVWSKHDVGVSFVVLPLYAAVTRAARYVPGAVLARVRMTRGLFAYSIISVVLIAATAYACTLLLDGLLEASGGSRTWTAVVVTLALALTPPVVGHAFLIFPETIAFFIVCWTVRTALVDSRRLGVAEMSGLALALGGMPWLHRKYSLFVIGLVVALLVFQLAWFQRHGRRTAVVLLVLFIAPQIALHAWTYSVWHHLGGPQLMEEARFSVSAFKNGVVGLWLDREYGLAAYSPAYLLALPAMVVAPRRMLWMLVPLLLLYLPMAAFTEWWGGFSPAGRYVMPATPLIAAMVARSFETRVMRTAAVVVLLFQMLIFIGIARHPRNLWPRMEGLNRVVAPIPILGSLYERLLPSLAAAPNPAEVWRCLAVVTLSTSVIAIAATLERRRR